MNLISRCKHKKKILFFDNDEDKYDTVETDTRCQVPTINRIKTQGWISDYKNKYTNTKLGTEQDIDMNVET